MDAAWTTAIAVACFAGGLAVGLAFVRGARAEAVLRGELRAASERERVASVAAELARVKAELAAERSRAAERAAEAERAREQVRAELELVASRLVEEKGGALLDRGREGLAALLGPVA